MHQPPDNHIHSVLLTLKIQRHSKCPDFALNVYCERSLTHLSSFIGTNSVLNRLMFYPRLQVYK